MNYEVLVNNQVWKRHVNQLLQSNLRTKTSELTKQDNEFDFPSPTDEEHSTSQTATASACYPSRDRRPPED